MLSFLGLTTNWFEVAIKIQGENKKQGSVQYTVIKKTSKWDGVEPVVIIFAPNDKLIIEYGKDAHDPQLSLPVASKHCYLNLYDTSKDPKYLGGDH